MLLAYARRRILTLIPVILGVTFFAFLMLHLVPVDPVVLMLEGGPTTAGPQVQVTQETYDRMRRQLGLDKPLIVQYGIFLGRVVRGDLGQSFVTKRDVWDMIAANAPATIELAAAGMSIAIVLGVLLGVLAAVRRDSWMLAGIMTLSVLGVSMPSFWLGIMFILLVSFKLGLLPVLATSGWQGLILPALVLGLRAAAVIARLTRSSLVEILSLEYIRTAWAKGLSGKVVVYKHGLRNALIPVVTVVGLQFGNLLSGAVVVETVFGREGLGSMAVRGINLKDFPLIQGTVLVLAISYVCVNLLVDLSYAWLNPEIRLGSER
jgi:ABC-type dipeptide/oligopeptide/nickel transport system permease component